MAAASDKYPASIRVLHWLMAAIIICLLAVGLIMTGMSHSDPNRGLLFSLHKSFGVTLLGLAALRIFLRLRLGVPSLPLSIPKLERVLALLGHYGFYAFMIALPVSGYVMTNSFGLSVHWFGAELPKVVGVDRDRGALFSDFHTYAAYALIALIVLHVAGALKHYFMERINLFSRMV